MFPLYGLVFLQFQPVLALPLLVLGAQLFDLRVFALDILSKRGQFLLQGVPLLYGFASEGQFLPLQVVLIRELLQMGDGQIALLLRGAQPLAQLLSVSRLVFGGPQLVLQTVHVALGLLQPLPDLLVLLQGFIVEGGVLHQNLI